MERYICSEILRQIVVKTAIRSKMICGFNTTRFYRNWQDDSKFCIWICKKPRRAKTILKQSHRLTLSDFYTYHKSTTRQHVTGIKVDLYRHKGTHTVNWLSAKEPERFIEKHFQWYCNLQKKNEFRSLPPNITHKI